MACDNLDKQLGVDRPIARRDFLNGVAIAIGSTVTKGFLPCLEWAAEVAAQSAQDKPGYYPPALAGMRGSHAGSFEVAHAERDNTFWKHAATPAETGEAFDLIVVGAGISGLAAAYFHRKQNPSAHVLILAITTISAVTRSEMNFISTAGCCSPTGGRFPSNHLFLTVRKRAACSRNGESSP